MVRDYLKHELETEVVMDRKYNWVAIVGQEMRGVVMNKMTVARVLKEGRWS